VEIESDELRSTPSQVLVTARAADFGAVVSVFSFQGRRIVTVKDYPPWRPPRQRSLTQPRYPAERCWRRWQPRSHG
jgi:hypothetical protein